MGDYKSGGKRNNGFNQKKQRRQYQTASAFSEQLISDRLISDQPIYGRNAVIELLKSGRSIDKILLKAGEIEGSLKLIAAEAAAQGIPVIETPKAKLDELCGYRPHQGVAAMVAERDYCSIDDILASAAARNEKPFVIIADGVEDPHNLGALIRAAECAGAHGIIIPKRRAVGLTGIVAKSSAGAIEHLPVAKVTNLASAVETLKKNGLWIFAAEADGEPYYDTNFDVPAALILGSEGFGVSHLLKEKSDYIVSIPMYGKVNSLNVSTAASVILFEVAKQRHR